MPSGGLQGSRSVLKRLGYIRAQGRFRARNLSHLTRSFRREASRPWGAFLSLFRDSRYDFFIVSQAVRSGSVSPTHYNVIYDSSGLKPDHIQRLTYKLCHVYYNWPVSVPRVGAPSHREALLRMQRRFQRL